MGFKENFKKGGGWVAIWEQMLLVLIGGVFLVGGALLWYGIEKSNAAMIIVGAIIVSIYVIGFCAIMILLFKKFLDSRNSVVPPTRACPVCSTISFAEELDTYDICDQCGWEDEQTSDPDDSFDDGIASGPNYMSLNNYKKYYEILCSKYPDYKWSKAFKLGKKRPTPYSLYKKDHPEIDGLI